MGYPIKQSQTARALVFLMVDATDHITGKTGLAPAVTLSKNGAAFGAPSGAVAEIGSGWYKVAGHAGDSDTLGPLVLHATATGADPTDPTFEVVSYDPQDPMRFGLAALPAVAAGAGGGLLTDKIGYALTAAYDAAKTAAQPSDVPSPAVVAGATAAQITADHGAGSYVRNTEPDNADILLIKAKTDNLPTDPASTSALVAAFTSVLNAVAALNNLGPSEVLAQVNAALTAAVADSVPADGARPSIAQAAYMNAQFLLERKVAGTTLTVFKPDGVTPLMTFTLDSATAPTAISRAS